jgi:Flp pilus assembly protein, ATPase CpaF
MSLRDRLNDIQQQPTTTLNPRELRAEEDQAYQELKASIHTQLLERIDLAAMEKMPEDRLRVELKVMVEQILAEQGTVLNLDERARLVRDIQNEVLGLGPLEPLLADPTISDILVNTCNTTYVERRGKIEPTDVRFSNNAHLMKIIDKIVSRIGRRVDESSPMVDARLPDGSRVNAIIPPLALDGPILSIRRFPADPLRMDDLLKLKSLTQEMGEIIAGLVKAKVNMIISGGTGTGKTTMLNVMSGFIPPNERIITIEDSAELQLQQPHVVRLETRPPNIEGKGEVTQRALVRNSLRMRPDRIIVGEVRGPEALDMLQAMNTGHEGSLTTIHANSSRDALTRLENMVGMAGMNLPPKAMRQQISSAISVVLQLVRYSDGKRRVASLQEITGMEGDIITMQEIFTYMQTGIDKDGNVLGHFKATGIRPKFAQRLGTFGIEIKDEYFDPTQTYE